MTWPSVRLADVADVRSGDGAPQELSSFSESGTPFVRAGSLVPLLAGASEYSLELIPQTVSSSRRMKTFAPGTVVFAKSGMSCTKGLVYQLVGPAHVVNHLAAIECGPELDSRFLLRWFERFSPSRLIANPAYPSVRISAIRDEKIPLPPLAEQKRIAGILDAADALRAKRRESLAQLDTFLQSTFLDMFGDPIGNGWEMVAVEDVARNEKRAIRTGPFGSQLLHSEFVDEGIRVLGIDNASANEFREGEPRFIAPQKYEQLRRYTVRPADILITIMGTCGRCAVVPDDVGVAINTKHLCCITLDRDKCLPEFMHAFFLEHPIARRYLERSARGAIMSGLNMGIIKALPIPMPPVDLQHRFASIVKSVEHQKASQRAHLAELDTLFASLQSRAFNGDL